MAFNFLANRRRTEMRGARRAPLMNSFSPAGGGLDRTMPVPQPMPTGGGMDRTNPVPSNVGSTGRMMPGNQMGMMTQPPGMDTTRQGMTPPQMSNPDPNYGLPLDTTRQGMNEMNYGLPTVNPALAQRRPQVY